MVHDWLNPPPPPFVALGPDGTEQRDAAGNTRPLAPSDLTPDSYQHYIARYRLPDIEVPPPARVSRSVPIAFTKQATPGQTYQASTTDETAYDLVGGGEGQPDALGIELPDGYRLASWQVQLLTYISVPARNPDDQVTVSAGSQDPTVRIAVGSDVRQLRIDTEHRYANRPSVYTRSFTYQPTRTPVTGSVAVTVWAAHLREFRAHLELGLERQADHLTAWQLRVFDRLSAEYQSLAVRHHEERSLRSVGSSGAIDGSSPMRNAEVVREELKRATIQLLSGGSYPPAAARTGVEDAHTGPAFDPDLATSSGPVVQFLEQRSSGRT